VVCHRCQECQDYRRRRLWGAGDVSLASACSTSVTANKPQPQTCPRTCLSRHQICLELDRQDREDRCRPTCHFPHRTWQEDRPRTCHSRFLLQDKLDLPPLGCRLSHHQVECHLVDSRHPSRTTDRLDRLAVSSRQLSQPYLRVDQELPTCFKGDSHAERSHV
jgi:hypothetical protein